MRSSALASSLLLALALSCTSELPRPPLVAQRTEALAQVLYPPPPARVEHVPARPRDDAVWIDGEWSWHGRGWRWMQGRWVVPPAGARFALWVTVRDAAGTLYLASGHWEDARGATLEPPTPLRLGESTSEAVVEPDGEIQTPSTARSRGASKP